MDRVEGTQRTTEPRSMKHFYTKATVEASAFCKICGKMTQHAVLGGRLAGCTKMHEHPAPEREKMTEDTQGDLFQ